MTEDVLLVYDLDLSSLEQTLRFLKSFFINKSFNPLKAETFLDKGFTEKYSAVLTLHLALDQEINTHRKISAQAELLGLKQLNPYFSLSEIFDNKMRFYEFMLAHGFKQAKTICIEEMMKIEILYQELLSKELDLNKEYLLKPCHGTESIGIKSLYFNEESLKLGINLESLTQILDTDLLLIQEKQNFIHEYKIVYFDNYLMSAKSLSSSIIGYCKLFINSLRDFSSYLSEPMNRLFSIDLLELSENDFIILEANARPAGIYKFSEFVYVI